MYSFLKAFLVLMKLLSLSQFYALKIVSDKRAATWVHSELLEVKLILLNLWNNVDVGRSIFDLKHVYMPE